MTTPTHDPAIVEAMETRITELIAMKYGARNRYDAVTQLAEGLAECIADDVAAGRVPFPMTVARYQYMAGLRDNLRDEAIERIMRGA